VKCPKCEHEQPDGALECGRCGVIFAKWKDGWDRPAPEWAPPQRVEAPPASSGGRTTLKAAGLLAVAAGLYWFLLWSPAGLPVPEQAYRDSEHAFALTAPEGWQAKKANDCKIVSTALTQTTACMVLELRREADSNRAGPSIQLTIAPIGALFKTGFYGSARITEGLKDALAEAIDKGFAGSIPGYASESKEIVSIDRIASLQLRGGATIKGTPVGIGDKTVTVPTLFGQTPEHHLTVSMALVPSGSRAYLLVGGGQTQDEASLSAAFDQAVQSFRVTGGRATPFQSYGGLAGSIPGDAILGFLVAATLALLKL
jgi:hypothetical protein